MGIQSGAPHGTRAREARGLRAPVLEVFSSVQGEGLYVGQPQVLLRLAGCPLRCRWCDTPGSWTVAEGIRARVRTACGARAEQGWATPFQVATWIAAVDPGGARPLSVTGGEPLLWPDFVAELATFLGARRVHLETAGAHPEALERVLPFVGHVSLDLKLPADLDAPVPVPGGPAVPRDAVEWAEARARCLELVHGHDACAKVIVSGARRASDYEPLLDDVAAIAPELVCFLQPVTPLAGVPAAETELVEAVAERALTLGLVTRVVPQVHRLLGMP